MDETRHYPGPTLTSIFVIVVAVALAALAVLSGKVVGAVLAIVALALAAVYVTLEVRGGKM